VKPTARIGHALFVYDLRPVQLAPDWVAQCTAPTPQLEPADIAEGFGRDDLRAIYFDCAQTAVWSGNTPRGWVVLPHTVAHDKQAFASRWTGQASLTFEQKQSFALPPYSIFLTPASRCRCAVQRRSRQFGQAAELLAYRLDHSTVQPDKR